MKDDFWQDAGGILEGKLREFACFSRKCGIIEITGGLLSEWRAGDLIFPGSSMVEQEAVNFEVAGSSPTPEPWFLSVLLYGPW